MLNFTLILIFFSQLTFAEKLSIDQKRSKILAIVDEELEEVKRLAKHQSYKVPDTLLRVTELNLEKARIYRELENEKYLLIPPEHRGKLNKKDYFLQSEKLFSLANESAFNVVKKFPSFSAIGEVYYILASNFKELGKDELAKKYFKLATLKVKDPIILNKSNVALADYYFNEKKYQEAIPYYAVSLRARDDKWWTKDAFNLSWCYYREKKYSSAISLMIEIHKKSGGKFVDMRSQVERDIGVFYIDANQLNEAINFFNKNGINYTEQFIKISTTLVSQGRFDTAENLLKRLKGKEKDRSKRIQVLLSELNLYDKFNKDDEHLEVAKELANLHSESPLNRDNLEKLNFQINKKAAEIQKAIASDIYKSVPKTQQQKAKLAIAYFELAGYIDPAQKSEKIFYQAETAYASNNFEQSIDLYIKSFDSAKRNKQIQIMKKCIEGMLSSLGNTQLDQAIAQRFYVPVYSRYLDIDSSSERASAIFVKLFNSQFDSNDINASESTLSRFAASFPFASEKQEGMLAKIMEFYRKKKAYEKVKAYINRINSGEFKVSRKYTDALRSLLTKIQIEGVQKSLEKGDKFVALKGYHQIFSSEDTTPKAKINAAYNLATLYFELGDTEKCFDWIKISLAQMDNSDVIKFADSFLTMAAGLFLRQQFAQSSQVSFLILTKLCHENASNKDIAFKNAAFISLANNDLDGAIKIKNTGKACQIPDSVISDVSIEILKELAKEKRWNLFEETVKNLEINSRNLPKLIFPLEEFRQELISIGDPDEANRVFLKQNRFYELSKSQKIEIPVEALDLIAERKIQILQDKKAKFDRVKLDFPEESFNNSLKFKLEMVDQMNQDVEQIQQIGSGKGIIKVSKIIIDTYEEFGLQLKEFSPPGKASAYVESFKKAMSNVYNPLIETSKKQKLEIKKLIYENKILSDLSFDVLLSEKENIHRFVSDKGAVLMDRGGRR